MKMEQLQPLDIYTKERDPLANEMRKLEMATGSRLVDDIRRHVLKK